MKNQLEYYQQKLSFEIDPSDLFQALEQAENIVIIDARQTFAYEEEHIPNAINLPHLTMNQQSTAHLDPKYLYICYCDGIGCNASTKGALNMAKLGFKAKELIGGLEWWIKDGYATNGNQAKNGSQIKCAC